MYTVYIIYIHTVNEFKLGIFKYLPNTLEDHIFEYLRYFVQINDDPNTTFCFRNKKGDISLLIIQ